MRSTFARHVVVLALLFASSGHAATYVVNTFDVDLPQANIDLANCDANLGQAGDQCTLRAAVMLANRSQQQDIIVLPLDTTIVLDLSGNGGAEVGDLDITAPVIITGAPVGFPADILRLPLIQSSTGERIFDVSNGADVEFRGLRLSGGNAGQIIEGAGGGAIRIDSPSSEVIVDTVRFSNNFGAYGGAISNAATLEIVNSDFGNNSTNTRGAHLYVRSSGDTTVRASSFRFSSHTGATREAIAVNANGRLTLENSMVDGLPLVIGGTPTSGIRADRPERLWIRNSTLAGFTDIGLDFVVNNDTDIQVFNSLVAYSGQQDCTISGLQASPGVDPKLQIEDSLIQSFDCLGDGPEFGYHIGDNVQTGVDPLLQPMTGQPGSLVFVRRIAFGSPAVDSGVSPIDDGTIVVPARQCLPLDIRGQPRPQDGDADGEARCDLGAVESSTLESSTFVVNQTEIDAVDANPGDDVCETAPGNGQCTLRAAVMEANAKPGPDVIRFQDSPGAAVVLTIAGIGGAHQGDLDITEQLVIEGNAVDGLLRTFVLTFLPQRLLDAENMPPGHTLTLRNLLLSNGNPAGPGGAVRAVNVSMVEIDTVQFAANESPTQGGAIAVTGGNLVIRDSEFANNHSGEAGAAVMFGGAGTALIERTSLWSNQSADGITPSVLHFDGAASARLFTSTVHGNSGGVAALSSASVDIRASTIVDNDLFGLRVIEGGAGTQLALRSSILADNSPNDCTAGGVSISGGYNLIGDGSCSPAGSNNLSGDPGLAPSLTSLDNQLGHVRLPLTGSPVIDAVPATGIGGLARCLALDQRQQPRPIDSDGDGVAACEIGAVELSQLEAGPREFVVNMTDDAVDNNPGDGRCDSSFNAGDQCSLRAAIMEANALPGPDSISIPLPGQTLNLTIPTEVLPPDDAHGSLYIFGSPVSITGVLGNAAERPLIHASHGAGLFSIGVDDVSLRGLRLSGGIATTIGGAVSLGGANNVLIEEVEMFGNSAAGSGGALAMISSQATLDRVDLHGNGTASDGAAIYMNTSDLTLNRSSVRDNIDVGPEDERQAIHVTGQSILTLYNSTVSDNLGHGVEVVDGTLVANNASIVGNSRHGVRFNRVNGEILSLQNSVLAGNSESGCAAAGAGDATISTDAFNLAQGDGCAIQSGATNMIESEPMLGPLQIGSGDFSAYRVPLPGSPLIDRGSTGGVHACREVDQLGTLRPVDGDGDGEARCDIGSIEAGSIGGSIFADGFED